MKKTIRVKVDAMFEFQTLEDAEAFSDFTKSQYYECPELKAVTINIIDRPKDESLVEKCLTNSIRIGIIPP